MTITKPLPANSKALRHRRFEASAHGPKNERGGYPALGPTARFTTVEAAKTWADETYPDAYLVAVTYYSETDGWQPHRAASRIDGTWDR